jgi:lipopolysaccharide export system protein LptA
LPGARKAPDRYNAGHKSCKNRAFMNNTFFSRLLVVFLVLLAPAAWGEKADRDKPMNIESDALRYDDVGQVSIFTGRVVLTKGTILIRGGKLEVRQDADGNQFGVATAAPGKLAFFRQKREGVDEFIEGEGETIEYDGRSDTVKFIDSAQLRRYRGATMNDEFNAGLIVYNNLTDVFTLDGAPAVGKKGSTGRPGAPAGRVRAMLTPNPSSAPAKAPAPAASAALRETRTLGAGKP